MNVQQKLVEMAKTNRSGKTTLIEAINLIDDLEEELRIARNNYYSLMKDHDYLIKDYEGLGVKYRFERDNRVPDLEKLIKRYEKVLTVISKIDDDMGNFLRAKESLKDMYNEFD